MSLQGLLDEAFSCARCEKPSFGRSPAGGFWKFPPIIGAQEHPQLLFVGLNPRRDAGNQALYDTVMESPRGFAELAANRVGKRPYIGPGSYDGDDHYALHLRVTGAAFPRHRFEEVAGVSEYYLCGGDRAVTRALPRPSRCAPHFLNPAIGLAKPRVVLPLGEVVTDHFRKLARKSKDDFHFRAAVNGHGFDVVALPHYGARTSGAVRQFQEALEAWGTRAVVALMNDRPVPTPPTRPT